jgi:hypothetical protein
LLFLFVALLVFALVLFPARTRQLAALAAPKVPGPALDARRGYSLTEAEAFLGAIGPEGRRLYALTELSLDLAFPVLYGLFFAGLLAFVLARAVPERRRVRRLAYLPLAMAVADISENLTLTALALSYPPLNTGLARLANVFTLAKYGLGVASGVVLIVSVLVWLLRALRRTWNHHELHE